MGDTAQRFVLISVATVVLASVVGIILWTVVYGLDVSNDLTDDAITIYSEAGLSMMVDQHNLESIDAANLYKMMEVNRNIITDYAIKDESGVNITDKSYLLEHPTERFKVVITGDSSIGFKVVATKFVEVEE